VDFGPRVIVRRGQKLYRCRRVPERFFGVKTWGFIWLAVGTEDMAEAEDRELKVQRELVAGCEAAPR